MPPASLRRDAPLDSRNQFREQRGAVRDAIHQNALVQCVRTFANRAQAIERRHSQRSRKIPI
jgi:hypothetical protein